MPAPPFWHLLPADREIADRVRGPGRRDDFAAFLRGGQPSWRSGDGDGDGPQGSSRGALAKIAPSNPALRSQRLYPSRGGRRPRRASPYSTGKGTGRAGLVRFAAGPLAAARFPMEQTATAAATGRAPSQDHHFQLIIRRGTAVIPATRRSQPGRTARIALNADRESMVWVGGIP